MHVIHQGFIRNKIWKKKNINMLWNVLDVYKRQITDLYHPNSRGSKGAETAAFRNDNINRGNQQKAIALV